MLICLPSPAFSDLGIALRLSQSLSNLTQPFQIHTYIYRQNLFFLSSKICDSVPIWSFLDIYSFQHLTWSSDTISICKTTIRWKAGGSRPTGWHAGALHCWKDGWSWSMPGWASICPSPGTIQGSRLQNLNGFIFRKAKFDIVVYFVYYMVKISTKKNQYLSMSFFFRRSSL